MIVVFRLALKEVVSKRLILIMLILTAVYLAVYAYGQHMVLFNDRIYPNPSAGMAGQWLLQEIGYQFLSLGWYIASFIVGAVAVFIGSASISREIETGTILGLAAKPITRTRIVIGKFLAYSLLSIIYAAALATAIVLINHHYFATPLDIVRLLKGVLIFVLLPLSLLAPAIYCSSQFSSMAAGIAMFFVFTVGIIGGFLEQIGALISNAGLIKVGVITSLITPGDALYRLAISSVGGPIGNGIINTFGPFGSASTPSVWMLIYSLVYIFALLLLGIRAFKNIDL